MADRDRIEALARKLARADGLDPDWIMIPRGLGGKLPLDEYQKGWIAPDPDQIVPAWTLYRWLAEGVIDG